MVTQADDPGVPGICRDCVTIISHDTILCPSCRGTRLIRHAELMKLCVAHVDCDAFYAAVEKRDRPDIADRPVIIGGGQRGVVATACYIARLAGVRSAQPMFKALAVCPDAVVIKPDFKKYSAVGRAIRARMLDLTPLVEPVSIDEAYLDLSGTQRVHHASPAELLIRLQIEIERDFGITVSIGLSANKFLAKTASEMDKPRGFAVLSPEDAAAFLSDKPVGYLHGVGPQLARKLGLAGLAYVSDIQRQDRETLMKQWGETGLYLWNRARGLDDRPVRADRERKSVSAEITFSDNIGDVAGLEDHLWQVCERTSERAKAVGVEGGSITLKLKTTRFQSLTRSTSLSVPTQLARTLFDATRPLLLKCVDQGPFRLIGVGVSHLSEVRGDVPDLVEPTVAKRAAAERAADQARGRFGAGAVMTGRGVRLAQQTSKQKKPGKKPGF